MQYNNLGFDNEKYIKEQTDAIQARMQKFTGKLYLECGGKLLFDYHASRVMPGFDPNAKMRVFHTFRDLIDVVICIYAGDIEKRKIRGDFGITYDSDALKLIDDFAQWGLHISGVVVTRYNEQPSAQQFMNLLTRRGIRTYTHRSVRGYPMDIDLIVSDKGYGSNSYIQTERPIVLVTGPGPGSGKMATCLSQLYHDYRNSNASGYAKFETFPIWNLPLKHPINAAYEAATADLGDINQIDHFHLDAYQVRAVNYNRDLEAFPLLMRIIEKITGGASWYKSPTDMGVNQCGAGIIDDNAVQYAAKQEIIRRFYRASCEYAMGIGNRETIDRIKLLMDELNLTPENRTMVSAAKQARRVAKQKGKGKDGIVCAAALMLDDGTVITGANSNILHASSALILNSVKHLAAIPQGIDIIPKSIMDSIQFLKKNVLTGKRISLDLDEVLIALAMSASINPSAEAAMEQLKKLKGTEVHLTHIPSPGDEAGLRKLGINVTSEPIFATTMLLDE